MNEPASRYTLNPKIEKLRAALARAERTMPLGQPMRSTHLYAEAGQRIDDLLDWVQETSRRAGGE